MFIYRFRWLLLVISLFLVAISTAGITRLEFATDYRAYFGDENPQLKAYDHMQDTYGRDDSLLFVIKPNQGTVFVPDVLNVVRELTDQAWLLPYATRVDSLTNFQHSYSEEDELLVGNLIPKRGVISQEVGLAAGPIALNEKKLAAKIISLDATTTMVAVTFTLPRKSIDEGAKIMSAANMLQYEAQKVLPDATIVITGVVPLNEAFNEVSLEDMRVLVPAMYLVLLVLLGFLLRSVAAVFVTMLVVAFSSASAMGLAGWLGIPLSPPVTIAPTIILTLAVADSVHVLVAFFKKMASGFSRAEAIAASVKSNFSPILLTTVTTAIGFASLNFSDAPPYNALGTVTAIGVGFAWLYSVFFLPAFLGVVPLRPRPVKAQKSVATEKFADFVIGQRKPLLIGMSLFTILLLAFIPRIELNDQFVEYIDESHDFRVATEFTMNNLTGIYQAQWELAAQEDGAVAEPEYLQKLAAFTVWLRSRSEVAHVDSFSDTLKRLNRNMHGDDPRQFKLPENRELAAQYILLYEISLPYGLDLTNQINLDKSATRVIATLNNITTAQMSALDTDSANWLTEQFPNAPNVDASGAYVMFAYIAKRNIETMFTGTLFAFVLISVVLIMALKSVKLGVLSIIPNVLPAAMSFGVWAILVGQVGLAGSVIAATTLGIVVDDTVHFLTKYQHGRKQKGLNPEDAIRYALEKVGRAIIVTTIVLASGFLILTFSLFQGNVVMGLLTSMALVFALAADFLLLPPLLMLIDKKTSPVATSTSTL